MNRIGIRSTLAALVGAAGLAAVVAGAAVAAGDFGQDREQLLRARSPQEFGVVGPLDQSSSRQVTAAQAAANPLSLVTLARGLEARVVTSGVAAPNIDMMALWPNDANPTHLIACNEEGTTEPGLQRIPIATGATETILTGTTSCDPVRRTPWGTILFAEEAGGGTSGGRVYELMNPLQTTGV